MSGPKIRPAFMRHHYYDGTKIWDLTEADILEHTMAPATLGLPVNTIGMWVSAVRMVGAGIIYIRTVAAGERVRINTSSPLVWWPVTNLGLFSYQLSVANDDWDIYCYGYVTQQ